MKTLVFAVAVLVSCVSTPRYENPTNDPSLKYEPEPFADNYPEPEPKDVPFSEYDSLKKIAYFNVFPSFPNLFGIQVGSLIRLEVTIDSSDTKYKTPTTVKVYRARGESDIENPDSFTEVATLRIQAGYGEKKTKLTKAPKRAGVYVYKACIDYPEPYEMHICKSDPIQVRR